MTGKHNSSGEKIGTDLERAHRLLTEGKLVAIPTETVYGLAGNALNPEAVAKIFQAKKRPAFDPLIIHTDTIEKVRQFTINMPEQAEQLAKQLWPGPLTLILPRHTIVPDLVTSGLDTVAVRIPRHPLSLQLLQQLDFPLAAPSANPFGYVSPTTAQHVYKNLGEQVAYILDGGECPVGIESTIVGFPEGIPTVYRKGGVSVEMIEQLIGPVKVKEHSSSQPTAPGMLKKHYSPHVPILLGDIPTLLNSYKDKKVGIISFKKHYKTQEQHCEIVLSERGDYAEAAQKLFATLRELDQLPLDVILTELLPEKDLGRAINDRLRRAAAK
ncbi:L-threonylcarbamoyladenylate synthase [Rapidithrix thailandica]|uniref:Threonylcarbamoyl-AMP synthase n=1 Tax=Rapidithrix thailandica TaxID=413964 RepID=A0AAW9S9T1_9BACT